MQNKLKNETEQHRTCMI